MTSPPDVQNMSPDKKSLVGSMVEVHRKHIDGLLISDVWELLPVVAERSEAITVQRKDGLFEDLPKGQGAYR